MVGNLRFDSAKTASFPLRKLKFIYSEKATKFCEIFLLLLTTVRTVISKEKISQTFVAFSEYMNFKLQDRSLQVASTFEGSRDVRLTLRRLKEHIAP